MNNWKHNHILDLSTFSLDDYNTVLELTTRFKDVHKSSSRKLPALQGRLITNLFLEKKLFLTCTLFKKFNLVF